MLRLSNIVKTYKVGDQEVPALRGLSLSFRKNEFVSILGPSGCGKTTTLNIIGGLDKYTSGDLVINGKSTSEYTDRDWDIYRNHRVGFIFQSYNLIPHQTILENVELALTIAGVSKAERIERSKKALEEVGLADQIYKKPNQLSGGQCQRVAIARALVNNPEILLADEPTGALDTQTSIQIMELIKKISLNRLVIMVTHNPELAEKYSTRIVRLLDGELVSDTNPYSIEDEIKEVDEFLEEENVKYKANTANLTPKEIKKYNKSNVENAKMSFFTAFKLSGRNLISKLKRTLMVAVAGCIGIVGVSAVLAVSTGVHNYIDDMEKDMISGNPITITESGVDYSALLDASSTMQQTDAFKEGWVDGQVNVNSMIEYLASHADALDSMLYQQEISEDYAKYILDMPKKYYEAIKVDRGISLDNNVYTSFTVSNNVTLEGNTNNISIAGIKSLYTTLLGKTAYSNYSSMITSITNPFMQYIDNEEYVLTQYEIVEGYYPKNANELVLVLDEDGTVSDLALAQLGFYTQEEFFNLIYNISESDFDKENNIYKKSFTFEEIMNKEFRLYYNDSVYKVDGNQINYTYQNPEGNYETLKISGILKLKSKVNYGCLSSGFYYTDKLVDLFMNNSQNNELENAIKNNLFYEKLEKAKVNTSFSYYYKGYSEKEYTLYSDGEMDNSSSGGMMSMMGMSLPIPPGFYISLRDVGMGNTIESISIYGDFKSKNKITKYLDDWNKNSTITLSDGTTIIHANDDGSPTETKYTDQIGVVMSMINSMVDMVTIALVAFTALSLVVSTVMVGIITYVSVVERVKEIGVIRSLGGRKKDVSHLFNAETFIIGLSSGVLGIIITGIITVILNVVVKHYSGFAIASLTPTIIISMILLSVVLTLISGLIPARAAAHKNPVDALRSE